MKKRFAILLAVMLAVTGFSTWAWGAEDDKDEAVFTPYIDGYEDGTFRPEAPVTWAEAIAMVSSLAGEAENIQTPVEFVDVAGDAWYAEAVADLSKKGFLEIYDESLEPDQPITRSQLAALAYQLQNGASSLTTEDLFVKAAEDGIIKGDADGSFRAGDSITRAEAVTLLNRILTAQFGKQDMTMLFKDAFSDVTAEHWAYEDIALASRSAHVPTSIPAKILEDYATKEFDKYNEKGYQWQTVGMVTKDMLDRGLAGGEGGQRLCGLAISKDGQFLMVGTDVAGAWISYDGGDTWDAAWGGIYARGVFAISIDPVNENRILVYGGYPPQAVTSERSNATNGIYLSEDKGKTFRQVLIQRGACMSRDFRESIAYDASSYDPELDRCMVAYWTRPWHLQTYPSSGPFFDESLIQIFEGDQKGLWKTEDGGETWFLVNGDMSDGVVKVNPENGTVYVANFKGFHRSTDGGQTFTTVLGGSMVYGLDVIDSYPNRVYVNDYEGVLVSEDSGATFTRIPTKNFPKSYDLTNPDRIVKGLKVSPANPLNMVVADFQGSSRYTSQKFYSNDGGKSWAQSTYDASDDFFKANNRDTNFVWDPNDPNKVWGFGGDWMVSSSDAGKTYKWDYNGGAAVCVPARHIFNIYNPDLFYYSSQDFHGAMTTDGGKTWKHMWNPVGSQGAGMVYGSYAADEKTMFAMVSTQQAIEGVGGSGGWNGVRELRVTHDGENWIKTGIYKLDNHQKYWSEKCYQSPNNPNVLFAANFRSDDYGYTWEKMENCNVVYTHNPYGKKELYGSWENTVVVSYDDGATWQTFATVIPEAQPENPKDTDIQDVAVDGVNNIVYYVAGNYTLGEHLVKVQGGVETVITDRLVSIDHLGTRIQLVTVDPRYPNVIYVGGVGGTSMMGNSVQRSVDGGETFQILSYNGYESSIVKGGTAGGFLVRDLIVHPVTGELWVMNSTRGWTKFAPPYEN